jgi:hypothetical protein
MLVVLTLNFSLFEPKFVLVLRLTRLSSSRRLAGMTADLACQMSSCLCQDYNILLLFKHKRDIHWKRRVHFTLSLSLKQAFKNMEQPRTSRYFFGEIFKFQMEIWRMRNKFPGCCILCVVTLSAGWPLIAHCRHTLPCQ